MYRRKIKKIISILFLCFVAMNAFADCELKVRVVEYQPQFYQESGKWRGMAIELMEVLLKEALCKPIYIKQPWKRALKSMEEGNLHIMLNLSISEERKKYMYFIGPQRDETSILAVSENSNYEINSLEAIKKLPGKIGMIRGAYFGGGLSLKLESDKAFAKKFHVVSHDVQLIDMFSAKRLIGFIIDRYDLSYRVKTHAKFKEIKAHSFFLNQDFVYFGLSKKSVSKELLARIQQAYDQAKAKGSFERVLKRYR